MINLFSSRALACLVAGCVAGAAADAAAQSSPRAGSSGKAYVRTSSNSPNSRLREVKAEEVPPPQILQPAPAALAVAEEPAPSPILLASATARVRRMQPESRASAPPRTMVEPMPPVAGEGAPQQLPVEGYAGDYGEPCCDPYHGGYQGGGYGGRGRDWFSRGRGRWFAGVEAIMARAHFSEPTAFLVREGPIAGPGNVVTTTETYNYYTFDYEANARAYVGYRLDPCCAEIRATYLRLDSEAFETDSTNANATRTPTFFEVQPGPNQPLFANTSVTGDIFDVDFARCMTNCEECYTSKCDPCDTVCCPPWDLQWSAGARLARWDFNTDVFTNVATDGRIDIDQEFIGAGPKIGLEARRYWGGRRQFSVYSTFDAALLIGQYEHHLERNVPPVGVNPASLERVDNAMTRAVPVTEIELGLKWQATRRASLSAGWFFQAWFDLGMSGQQTSNVFGGLGPQFMLDDSNIMSWDGLTLRGEYTF